MNIKRIFMAIIAASIIVCGIMAFAGTSLRAEDAELSKKLAEIVDNQKMILAEISAIKEDLRIIKIRITQNQ
jgi:hypothetical protein